MDLLARLEARAAGAPRRILFSDIGDPRVLAAIAELSGSRLVSPVLLDPLAVRAIDRYRSELAERRGLPLRVAAKLLDRPVNLALALLADGVVDGAVLGVSNHTSDVLVACEMMLGLTPGVTVASSLFVLEVPGFAGPQGNLLCFADCAVNPSPTAEQLADIAIGSADTARAFVGLEPRVAMLSFSSHGSASHPDAEKVSRAVALARARRPDLKIDGELQADCALDAGVAAHKLPVAGEVAGRANVLVFPDLDAGNIGYKLVRTLAGAPSVGAFLQGYGKPVAKLSRGASTAEIAATAMMLAAACGA